MTHAFKMISAKSAFGNLTRVGHQNVLHFNKTNLIAGLYSKMDLKEVCTISNGSPCSLIDTCSGCSTGAIINANSSEPFYQQFTIDPLGTLFGKTACGTNNFTSYMVYSP